MLLKVLSWNIWAGKNLEKVIALLLKVDADIIGLQEVLGRNNQNNAAYIAQKLGLNYCYCKAFTDDRHNAPTYQLGNAVLTKFNIEKSFCHGLSSIELYLKNSETEPRTAVEVNLKVNGKNLNLFNAHLAHSPALRPSKMRDIQFNNLLKALSMKQSNNSTILLGDFNSQPDSEVIKNLEKKLINTDKDPSRTTAFDDDEHGKFQFRKDYIFVSPDIKVKSFRILAADASDHLPIMAEIEL